MDESGRDIVASLNEEEKVKRGRVDDEMALCCSECKHSVIATNSGDRATIA